MEQNKTDGSMAENEQEDNTVTTELLIIEGVDEYISFEKFFQTEDCS